MKNALHYTSLFLLIATSCSADTEHLSPFAATVIIMIFVFAVAVIIASIHWRKQTDRQEKAIEDAVSKRADFTETKALRGEVIPNLYYLGIDEKRRKAYYILDGFEVFFSFKDVVSAEICENCAAPSGLLSSCPMSMYVHVLLRDHPVPSFDITFYEISDIKHYNSSMYLHARDKAQELVDAFELMIDKASADSKQMSIVRQIKELSKLHEQGVLTDDEFSAMKRKLTE